MTTTNSQHLTGAELDYFNDNFMIKMQVNNITQTGVADIDDPDQLEIDAVVPFEVNEDYFEDSTIQYQIYDHLGNIPYGPRYTDTESLKLGILNAVKKLKSNTLN